jgi:hypothetical protein
MALPDIVLQRPGRPTRIGRWYVRRRYAILFYSLLFTIAFIPVTTATQSRVPLIKALLVANLVAAALSTMTRKMRRALFGSAIAVFLLVYPVELIFNVNLLTGGLGLWSVTAAVAAGNAVVFAIRARRVDSEHLFAALSAYLLAGLVFGVIHYVLERAVPGSYAVNGVPLLVAFDISEAVYFSFVTLATLGYGDIVPTSEAARSIAIVEAIIGQLYLAVMIARIVSMYVPRNSPGDDDGLA